MSIAVSSSFRERAARLYFVPVLGPIVGSRLLSVGVLFICLIQITSLLTNSQLWPCPMLRFTSVPCPGCGLSRAIASLARADFRGMAIEHVLAPGFVVGIALCLAGVVMPARARTALARIISKIESTVPVTTVFLSVVILYWVARLVTGHHPDLH